MPDSEPAASHWECVLLTCSTMLSAWLRCWCASKACRRLTENSQPQLQRNTLQSQRFEVDSIIKSLLHSRPAWTRKAVSESSKYSKGGIFCKRPAPTSQNQSYFCERPWKLILSNEKIAFHRNGSWTGFTCSCERWSNILWKEVIFSLDDDRLLWCLVANQFWRSN